MISFCGEQVSSLLGLSSLPQPDALGEDSVNISVISCQWKLTKCIRWSGFGSSSSSMMEDILGAPTTPMGCGRGGESKGKLRAHKIFATLDLSSEPIEPINCKGRKKTHPVAVAAAFTASAASSASFSAELFPDSLLWLLATGWLWYIARPKDWASPCKNSFLCLAFTELLKFCKDMAESKDSEQSLMNVSIYYSNWTLRLYQRMRVWWEVQIGKYHWQLTSIINYRWTPPNAANFCWTLADVSIRCNECRCTLKGRRSKSANVTDSQQVSPNIDELHCTLPTFAGPQLMLATGANECQCTLKFLPARIKL